MKDILLKALDWEQYDDCINKFTIDLFGKDKNNKNLVISIKNYKPYFYLKIGRKLLKTKGSVEKLLDEIYRESGIFKKPESTHLLKRKFNTFKALKQYHFYKLEFDSFSDYKNYLSSSGKVRGGKYKKNIYGATDTSYPLLTFFQVTGVKPASWLTISNYKKESPNCYAIDYHDIKTSDINHMTKFVIASFDIECVSEDNHFPSNRPGDKVISISFCLSYSGEQKCYERHVFILGSCDDIDGVNVHRCSSEKEVIISFARLVKEKKPDFLLSFNGFGFDYTYLKKRANYHFIVEEFSNMVGKKNDLISWIEKETTTTAHGVQIKSFASIPGCIAIDLMSYVQQEMKLSSYSLDSICKKIFSNKINSIVKLGDNICQIKISNVESISFATYVMIYSMKDNVTEEEIFSGDVLEIGKGEIIVKSNSFILKSIEKMDGLFVTCKKRDVKFELINRSYHEGPKERKIIAQYNVLDSELLNAMCERLKVIQGCIELSNVSMVPITDIFYRGQSIRSLNIIENEARVNEYLVKKHVESSGHYDKGMYKGAQVLTPTPGIYPEPIPVLDYNSLYPTCIIAYNLSNETHVEKKKYLNNDNFIYHKVQETDSDKVNIFAESKEGNGIIPNLLKKLISKRKEVKKQMAQEKDNFIRDLLDARQASLKRIANSIYGLMGSNYFVMKKKEIAASTTSAGVLHLTLAKNFVDKTFCELIKSETFYEFKDILSKFYACFMNTEMEIPDERFNNPFFYFGELPKIDLASYGIKDDMAITEKYKKLKDIDNKEEYHDALRVLNNQGFTNKNEFIEKSYNFVRHLHKEISPVCIYGDTDSIFIKLVPQGKSLVDIIKSPGKMLLLAMDMGCVLSAMITIASKPPFALAYEKTFFPFILFKKKKYYGRLYEKSLTKSKDHHSAIETKRKDTCIVERIFVENLLKAIRIGCLNAENVIDTIKKYLIAESKNILNGVYPHEYFAYSKTLRGPSMTKEEREEESKKPKEKRYYVNRSSVLHVSIADRAADRDPGSKPLSNEKIRYVFFVPSNLSKRHLKSERAEMLSHVIENKIKLDYKYYLTNYISRTVDRILILFNNPEIKYLKIIKDILD